MPVATLTSRTTRARGQHEGENDMIYRKLGASGLDVAPVWLGAMMFGLRTDRAEAGRIVAHAREHGLNTIDTADAYNGGESERIVGELIAKDRNRWVLATKVANAMGEGPNRAGLSRRWMIEACEASLTRLGTDSIDLYWLHKEDPETPLEETVAAVGDLIRQGKVRYFGVSNYRAWKMARIAELCRAMGVPPPIAVQPPYSAVTRGIEIEVIPCAVHYGMGVVPYSPLARGVLTGKYAPGAPLDPESRAGRQDKRIHETEFRAESLDIAQKIAAHAQARGMTATGFALAWVLANAHVTALIAGPRTLEQWRDYVAAVDLRLTADDEAFVDGLVAPGHASTPGYTDPAYPVRGRVPHERA
jgi:aryl-alcohol dehydrogenase (NADP+)